MAAFLAIVLGLPTVIFTVMMGFVALYWALVMLGAVDLELFDLDVDLDLDLDVDVDPGLDGAVDSALDGAAASLDAGDVADAAGAAEGAGFVTQVLLLLGVGRVPVMVLVSLFVFAGWIVSFLGTWAFGPFTGSLLAIILSSTAVLGASAVAGVVAAAAVARPLTPLFRTGRSRERRSLIGESVELSTGRVDGAFGQGVVAVSDADLLVQVRCDRDNGLRRGDRALIVSFDTARDAFVVEPITPRDPASTADRTSARPLGSTQTTS